jgi:hypothetical protein
MAAMAYVGEQVGMSTEARYVVPSHRALVLVYSLRPRNPCERSSSRSNSLNNSPL